MAAQLISQDLSSQQHLSPQLRTVLSSLSVSLESELNRYRRNRHYQGLTETDLFAEIEDPAFDLEAIGHEVEVSIAQAVATAKPITPPPPPRNKKLLQPSSSEMASNTVSLKETEAATAATGSALAIASAPSDFSNRETTNHTTTSGQTTPAPSSSSSSNTSGIVPTGYLTSSEALIDSLADCPLPDPVDINGKPQRKTLSLLAGASLGFFGLTAGLSVSYLMANPTLTQRLANRFGRQPEVATVEAIRTFDPPGPDLSANEFIDLDIDNLSSLTMPQANVLPGGLPGELAPSNATATAQTATLESGLAAPNAPNLPAIQPATTTPTGLPTIPTAPTAQPIETQAVVVPVGLTYYVTAPVTTEQGLATIRQTVGEAFVRRFADGNRIQIAAFDNPQAAQAMLTELSDQNITAQIYGPTTE